MTWLKLSDDFPAECVGLSNGAFRTHVEGLAYVMQKETGGIIAKNRVKRFAESGSFEIDIEELVACGFWTNDGDRYTIRHHMEHQPEPEIMAKRRADNAARQRKSRFTKAKLAEPDSSTS